jgi:xylitol oxidase
VTERNWAGNHTFEATVIAHPATVEDLQELVTGANRVRALGSRHSFNSITDSSGTLTVLDRFEPHITVDSQAMTVTVSGGTRYGVLATELQRQGFALHNLASLPHISVAGAVATGTHGSGDGNRNLAAAVTALEMVTADGTILSAGRGDPSFEGMVVGLGALGIVTRLTLDLEQSYYVSQTVYENLDWDLVLENFDDVTSAAYSVSLFTDWSGQKISQAWLKRKTSEPGNPVPEDEFFGGRPATVARHPLPSLPGSSCTQQLGVTGPWSDRLAHFRMDFTPSKGDELQSEYLIPREHALEALNTVRSLSDLISPLLLVGEVRTVAGDDLWLSPSYGSDRVGLHFTWQRNQHAVKAILPQLEAELAPFAARPHWGKLFHCRASTLAPLYPRFDAFIALADRMDPDGKFRNNFLKDAVFGIHD